jgi:D-amino-acid dehydrogenase
MQKNIVIVGGGVIGLSCAYYLLAEGHRVTLIDKDSPEANLNCSTGNAGMIVPSHFIPLAAPGVIGQGLKWMLDSSSPFYIKPRLNKDLLGWLMKFWKASNQEHVNRTAKGLYEANQYSLELYKSMAEEAGMDIAFEQKGLLMLCQTEKGLEEEIEVAERAHQLGIRTKIYRGEELKELEPNIQIKAVGAVHYVDDANIDPVLFVKTLLNQLKQNANFSLLVKREVLDFKIEASKITAVELQAKELISCDELILAAGTYSQDLAKKLKLKLPIQAGKGYSMTVKSQAESLKTPTILCEARVAVTPFGDSIRFGGTMELGGTAYTINANRLKGIVNAAGSFFPKFDTKPLQEVEPWSGLRPCPPDGIPYIGRINTFSNLTTATGHGMMGLSMAPATGKIVADIISGKESKIDVGIFNPNRY